MNNPLLIFLLYLGLYILPRCIPPHKAEISKVDYLSTPGARRRGCLSAGLREAHAAGAPPSRLKIAATCDTCCPRAYFILRRCMSRLQETRAVLCTHMLCYVLDGTIRARSHCRFIPPLIHPLHTRFTDIFGTSVSEATMRPNPRHDRLLRAVGLQQGARHYTRSIIYGESV